MGEEEEKKRLKNKIQQQGKTQEANCEEVGYKIILSAPETTPELRSPPAQFYKSH